MTPRILRSIIGRLEISQAAAAALIDADPRTFRRYLAEDLPIPPCVAILFRLLDAGKITIADINQAKR